MPTYEQVETALHAGGDQPITHLLAEQGKTIDTLRQDDFELAALLVRVQLRYAYTQMQRDYRQSRRYDNHFHIALEDLKTYLDAKGNTANAQQN